MEQIRQKVVDELFALTMLEVGYHTRIDLLVSVAFVCCYITIATVCCAQTWYAGQVKMVNDWLTERVNMPLHPYQLNCLMSIVRVSVLTTA
jgi:hypothetical protein